MIWESWQGSGEALGDPGRVWRGSGRLEEAPGGSGRLGPVKSSKNLWKTAVFAIFEEKVSTLLCVFNDLPSKVGLSLDVFTKSTNFTRCF